MKSIKKILSIGMIITLIAALAISVFAYQFGSGSSSLSTSSGTATIRGYIYTTDTSGGVGADTTTSMGLSSSGVQSIYARIVGYPGVTRSYGSYPNYISVTATGSGGTNAMASHEASSSISGTSFFTP